MTVPITKAQWAEIRRDSQSVISGIGQITAESMGRVLLPYQAKGVGLLASTAVRVLVVEKSRRIGFTWGLASYAALTAAKVKSAGGMDVMYISYSQEMTREFIDACAMWARAFATAALDIEEFVFESGDAEGKGEVKAFRIQFASGFEVIALSSAPRSLRGKQGVVIVDEAAFVDNLDELLKAALANLIWGGKVVVCSTHNGTDNPFNVLVQDVLGGRRNYAHMHIDLDEALQQGFYKRICLVRGLEWSPEAEAEFREGIIADYGDGADEELYCIPSQGSGAWLTTPLIEARMSLRPEDAPILRLELPPDYLHRPELDRAALIEPFIERLEEVLKGLDPKLRHALGFDFGRVADLTVLKLLAIEQHLRRRSALTIELRNVPGDEQKRITRMVMRAAPRLICGAFDATGMGWTVAEDMGREFGLYDAEHNSHGRVRAIKFSQDWYRTEMPPVKTRFEDAGIALAPDDDHLGDLRLVKVIRGIPMVPAVRTTEKGDGSKKGKKRHGDFAIALALADFASRQEWHEYDYETVAPPQSRYDEPISMASFPMGGGGRMFETGAEPYRMASLRKDRGIPG